MVGDKELLPGKVQRSIVLDGMRKRRVCTVQEENLHEGTCVRASPPVLSMSLWIIKLGSG
jgi:hypothetical protein